MAGGSLVMNILKVVCCIFLPPVARECRLALQQLPPLDPFSGDAQVLFVCFADALAVYLDKQAIDDDFIISVILMFCGWIPGIIFAFWCVRQRHQPACSNCQGDTIASLLN